jgi:hypothetical protein
VSPDRIAAYFLAITLFLIKLVADLVEQWFYQCLSNALKSVAILQN